MTCLRCDDEGLVTINPGWPDPQCEVDGPCPDCAHEPVTERWLDEVDPYDREAA